MSIVNVIGLQAFTKMNKT